MVATLDFSLHDFSCSIMRAPGTQASVVAVLRLYSKGSVDVTYRLPEVNGWLTCVFQKLFFLSFFLKYSGVEQPGHISLLLFLKGTFIVKFIMAPTKYIPLVP